MKIDADQYFLSLLYAKGIEVRDYDCIEELLPDAIDTKNKEIIKYIAENYSKKLLYPAMVEAVQLPFELFEEILDALIMNSDIEDIVIEYFRNAMGTDKEIPKFLHLFFEIYEVDPNGKYGRIFTEACHYGIYNAVKYLVEKKDVDVDTNDSFGYILAVRFGQYKVAKYLAEQGANINAKRCLALKLLQKERGYSNKDKQWLINCYKLGPIPRGQSK